jgi:quercetin dioxygenase-like cupin family protein
MASRFEDHRGVIEDLLYGQMDCVTRISTVKGAVRGNHVHKLTSQWTYVMSGRLLVATSGHPGRKSERVEREFGPGDLFCEGPGVAHAWKALENTVVLVFTRGPRSGEGYESDTVRLEKPLL